MTQLLAWLFLIGPWLLLMLLPLDPKRVRRFLSVTFFTVFVTIFYWQMGIVFNWWTVTTNIVILNNIPSYGLGLNPVVTLLIFYFTYSNVWLWFGVNIIADAGLAFILWPFIGRFGFANLKVMSNLELFILVLTILPWIFLYQRWYDKS